MQHTVLAFFDTYPQAEAARDALVAAGIAQEDVVLKARCEPTYASDATSAGDSAPTANEGLLASIERRTATGRRDYAILLLLARLGLRAGEVASLQLDDIDWTKVPGVSPELAAELAAREQG